MGKRTITDEMITSIGQMVNEFSNSEIAKKLKISLRSVNYIIRNNDFRRTKDARIRIQSRIRKALVKSERRRAIFGFEQQTNLKVFSNRERLRLRQYLKRCNYKFLTRGGMTAYFDSGTRRVAHYEARGRKVGLKFQELEPAI